MKLTIKICFLISVALFLFIDAKAQVPETNKLKKKFGFQLPNSATASLKLKTKSKVTYLMIEIPSADAKFFKLELLKLTPQEGRLVAREDADCKGQFCLGIGNLPIKEDAPEACEKWWKDRKARNDLLMTISNYRRARDIVNGESREFLQGTSSAVIWFDSKNGFLWLSYRG
jgi:hypothetical protein